MPPRLPPHKHQPTPITAGVIALMESQWSSPYARELGEAVALVAGGQEMKAALLLRQVTRLMEDSGDNPNERAPVLRLSADAWYRAAVRFANTPAEYTAGVRQSMRIDFLLESLEDYKVLEDVPNQIQIYREIAEAHLSRNDAMSAAGALWKALGLIRDDFALPPQELRQLFTDMVLASKAAFDKHPTVEMAMRTAGLSQLLGDSPQAIVYLSKAQEQILSIANAHHQLNHHEKALAFLSQAVVLGIASGRENVIVQYADLLIQYAISNGDQEANQVYDRALRLAQAGAGEMSERTIQTRVQILLDRPTSRHAVEVFHDLIDFGTKYFVSLAKVVTQEGYYQDPKVLDTARALMDVAYQKSDAWQRTLDALEPFLGKPFVERLWKDGMTRLRMAVAEHDAAIKLAGKHYRAAGVGLNAVSPALASLVGDANLDHPEALQPVYMQLARDLNCSMADVELVFTPYGDGQLRGRLNEALGDLTFAHLRSKAMMQGLNARQIRWEEFVRENGSKK